jgi:cadmium resistance protein CadD (predicted permease)
MGRPLRIPGQVLREAGRRSFPMTALPYAVTPPQVTNEVDACRCSGATFLGTDERKPLNEKLNAEGRGLRPDSRDSTPRASECGMSDCTKCRRLCAAPGALCLYHVLMHYFVEILAASVLAFAAANIGDLFVLLLFFSDEHFRAYQIVIGQYLGVGLVIALSIAGSVVASMLPHGYIRLLGVVPILVGAQKLSQSKYDRNEIRVKSTHANILSVAAVAFADCSDDLAIFTPLYARSVRLEKIVITAVFLFLIGVWCGLAFYLTTHRKLGSQIRLLGGMVAPWVLIALGLFILL